MDPRIADYITANRRKYTRQAIRQQLVDAGHDPAEVDRTWAALEAKDPDAVIGDRFWGRFALIVLAINVAVFLLVAVLTGMLAYMSAGAVVLPVIFAVILGIGALIAWGIVALTGPDKMGSTTALTVGISVPLLFALLIGGSCYALVGSMGTPPPPPQTGTMELTLDPPLGFTGAGTAMCQSFPEEGSFNVFGENLGTLNGAQVSAAFYTFGRTPAEPGVPAPAPGPGMQERTISVTLLPTAEGEMPGEWYTAPETDVEMDVAADNLSGSVRFTNLLSAGMAEGPVGGGEQGDPISGSISWTCE